MNQGHCEMSPPTAKAPRRPAKDQWQPRDPSWGSGAAGERPVWALYSGQDRDGVPPLRVNACPHGRDYVNRCCRHGYRSSRSAHPVATRRRPAAWPRDKGPAMPGSGYRPYRLRRYPVWLLWWSSSDPELRIALSALERPNCTWRSPCPRKCPNGVVFLYPALSEDDTPTYRSQGCAAL